MIFLPKTRHAEVTLIKGYHPTVSERFELFHTWTHTSLFTFLCFIVGWRERKCTLKKGRRHRDNDLLKCRESLSVCSRSPHPHPTVPGNPTRMLKKSMYGKADDLSYQSALVCDGLFPFCPANTYCFLANDILLSIRLLILFRFFSSSILIKHCLLCCQGHFSQGGGRTAGRQHLSPRQEAIIRESKAIIKRGPQASHSVTWGKREIWTETKSCREEKQNLSVGMKNGNEEERKGLSF